MTGTGGRDWVGEHVSRETLDRLQILHDLLLKWQSTINLIAKSSVSTMWQRHFADSVQLWQHAPAAPRNWLDLGSGGGFPALVIAAISTAERPDMLMTLVESDTRKCGFLREASRLMGVETTIINERIENLPPQQADVVSARALDDLQGLLAHAIPHLTSGGMMLFPKGKSHKAELEKLPSEWQASTQIIPSRTDPSAVVLRITTPNTGKPLIK